MMDLALGVRGPGTSWAISCMTVEECRRTAAAFEATDAYAALVGDLGVAIDAMAHQPLPDRR